MKIKKLLPPLFLFNIILSFSMAQSIQDYVIPELPNNTASFSMPGHSEISRTINYTKIGVFYKLTDIYSNGEKQTSLRTIILDLSQNEAKMVESTLTTLIERNTHENYDPGRIILKMPNFGQTARWDYMDISGDLIKCISSWDTIMIKDVIQKAFIVTKVYDGNKTKILEYYVRGIGLCKTETKYKEARQQIAEKFDGLSETSASKQIPIEIKDSIIERPLLYAEVMPEYPGGDEAMLNFIKSKLHYTPIALKESIEGIVYITFIINKDGKVKEVKIIKDIGGGLGEIGVEAVRQLEVWKPGRQGGRAVPIQYTLPIKFTLSNKR
jgi:TonB family protein